MDNPMKDAAEAIKLNTGYHPIDPDAAARMNAAINEKRREAMEKVMVALEPLSTNIDRVVILRAAKEFYSLDVCMEYHYE